MTRPAAIILCGGASRRMGRPKAWLSFGRERMLQRVARLVGQTAEPVVVVAARDQPLPELPDQVIRAVDEEPDRGPLQGLLAGLKALPETAELVYATATDAPFLAPGWIDFLAERIGGADIALPYLNGHFHPLAALYRRAPVLKAASALLAAGDRRLASLQEVCRTRDVSAAELSAIDPEGKTVQNLNTPEDYRRALESAEIRRPAVVLELRDAVGIRPTICRWLCQAFDVGEAFDGVGTEPHEWLGRAPSPSSYRLLLNGEPVPSDRSLPLCDDDRLVLIKKEPGYE